MHPIHIDDRGHSHRRSACRHPACSRARLQPSPDRPLRARGSPTWSGRLPPMHFRVHAPSSGPTRMTAGRSVGRPIPVRSHPTPSFAVVMGMTPSSRRGPPSGGPSSLVMATTRSDAWRKGACSRAARGTIALHRIRGGTFVGSSGGDLVVRMSGGAFHGGPGPNHSPIDAVAVVRADLAARLTLSLADVRLVGIRAATWDDSSLGCPAAGQVYLPVLTPGYRILPRSRWHLVPLPHRPRLASCARRRGRLPLGRGPLTSTPGGPDGSLRRCGH